MGSIIGEGFSKYVTNQISQRQKAMSIEGRNVNNLQAKTTGTSFIRLASGVNIYSGDPSLPGASTLDGMINSGLFANITDGIQGDALAKNFVLFGGVINEKGGSKNLYSGISGGEFGGAYGFQGGGNERGYVPMPGITGCQFKYKNDGALATATVDIKAWNRSQFQAIDVLFQRPGYTCLLEFGNTVYLGNDGKTVYRKSFSTKPFSNLWKEKQSMFKLATYIEDEKESWEGNYEAMYAKITKFNWTFNSDGSYDIKVNLVGMGDVIASLKINAAPTPKLKKAAKDLGIEKDDTEDAASEGFTVVADAISSVLNFELFKIFQRIQEDSPGGFRRFFGADGTGTGDLQVDNFSTPTFASNGFTNGFNKPKTLNISKGIFKVTGVDNTISSDYEPQVYITFGSLLAIIQSTCNLVAADDSPLIAFNFDFEDLANDTNYMKTFPGNFSGDPTKCIVAYQPISPDITDFKLAETDINDKLLEGPKFAVSGDNAKGRIANVYLDINWIAETLSQNKDEDDDIYMLQFIKSILTGMNNAMGGLNEFRIISNKDTGLIEIVSETPQENAKERALTTINTYGVTKSEGSFMRSMDLNSELSDKFATMVTIGAQADGNTSAGNATAFSIYNKGLIDRLTPVRKSSTGTNESAAQTAVDAAAAAVVETEDEFKELFDEDVVECFESIYDNKEFTQENISALNNINQTFCSLATGKLTQKKKYPAPFFLPFNLKLTMDGLGGMKIYEAFKVDGKALPPTYKPSSIELVIKSLSHTISGNDWTTEIETLSKPIFGDVGQASSGTYTQGSTSPNPSSGGGGGSGTGAGDASAPTSTSEPPASLDPLGVTRFNAMQKSYNAVFSKFGEISGMCGQYSYNMAVNYCAILRSDNDIPKKRTNPVRPLAAGGNANQNEKFWKNLVKLGYSQTKVGTNISKAKLNDLLKNTVWGYGDVAIYYANDGSGTHVQYGHAQVYVGTINSVGWSTSTKKNYGVANVYNRRPSNKWDFYILRAPSS